MKLVYIKLFQKIVQFVGMLFLAFPIQAMKWSDLWQSSDQQAALALSRGHYQQAAEQFKRLDWRAVAYYKSGHYQEALNTWNQLLLKSEKEMVTHSPNKILLSDIYFDRGNTLVKMGLYQEAVFSYQKAIVLNPNNDDGKFNLELLNQLLKNNPKLSSNNQNSKSSSQGNNNSKPGSAASSSSVLDNEPLRVKKPDQAQALQQWVRQVPDNPGGLLKQKFLRDKKREEFQQLLDRVDDSRA